MCNGINNRKRKMVPVLIDGIGTDKHLAYATPPPPRPPPSSNRKACDDDHRGETTTNACPFKKPKLQTMHMMSRYLRIGNLPTEPPQQQDPEKLLSFLNSAMRQEGLCYSFERPVLNCLILVHANFTATSNDAVAFVGFVSEEMAHSALLDLNGIDYHGRPLDITLPKPLTTKIESTQTSSTEKQECWGFGSDAPHLSEENEDNDHGTQKGQRMDMDRIDFRRHSLT